MRLMKLLERRKIHEKETEGSKLMRAGIQLAFFIAAPSLFSTAFAGIKSIFLAIGSGQAVEWNSFLTVTAVLLIFTCFFGRHFCGYACAFGFFGDAVYEGFSWIWTKCFHKKRNQPFLKSWSTDFRKSNISYWP